MIKNLILDMGGVILDVDYNMIFKGFASLGIKNLETFFTQQTQLPLVDDFEVGKITPNEFRQGVRDLTKTNISDKDIDFVWNSMVLGVRKDDILLIKELRNKYEKIYLFSNTNEIHMEYVKNLFLENMGFDVLNEMFDKVYLSNEIHERKPNVSAFNFVANDAGIDKTESLFIDDTDLNIQGAIKAGLHARLLPKDKTLLNLKQEGVI